jgi:hypothetical protein
MTSPDVIDEPEVHDMSRLDKFLTAHRRATLMHAVWKPALAGAAGAALVIGCVWVVLPKISVRDYEVPRISYSDTTVPRVAMQDTVVPNIVSRDVETDHVVVKDVPVDVPKITITPHDVPVPNIVLVPHEVEIDVPRVVTAPTATPAPRSPQEEGFERSEGWREAVVRGRILREDRNGFVLATGEGEQSFYPVKVRGGKALPDLSVKDVVEPYLDDLCFCRSLSTGVYECTALHAGREVAISQVPIGAPL